VKGRSEKLLLLTRRQKVAVQMLADSIFAVLCFYAAMVLRLESNDFRSDLLVWVAFATTIPAAILSFRAFGLYRVVTRFITARSFRAIFLGVTVSAVVLFVSAQMLDAQIPRSVPGIFAVLYIGAVGGARFVVRRQLRFAHSVSRQPIAIYGAGEAGRQLFFALKHGKEYLPVAFLDDNRALQNTLIGDVQVFSPEAIDDVVADFEIKTILLALPSVSRARRREILQKIEHLEIEIMTIPGMADIVSGRASFTELRQVSPVDLLGRDPVPPRPDLMRKNIEGKVVLVSGAGGSIGSELCRQILTQGPRSLILLEVSEFALYSIVMELRETAVREGLSFPIEPILGSVQNPGRVREILRAFRVQTVFHAAAYKHVVLVEENVVEGIRNNVFGTQVIAEAAAELGVENFILISTDKAVRPTNFMGASKRMAELVCQALAENGGTTRFSMVRFGNVLGSSGSVIPRFKAQIEQGGPVTVTHREITRYFMTIPEASQLVIQASAMAKGGDVFVLDMGEPVKILDMAQSMIRLYGLKPYVMETDETEDGTRGDIGIRIVGLNKGEKLYEELLIGHNPQGTDHPRIMTATEVSLPKEALQSLLERLQKACLAFDIPQIRQIFEEAPLEFQPSTSQPHDLLWNAAHRRDAHRTGADS